MYKETNYCNKYLAINLTYQYVQVLYLGILEAPSPKSTRVIINNPFGLGALIFIIFYSKIKLTLSFLTKIINWKMSYNILLYFSPFVVDRDYIFPRVTII